MTVKQFIVLIIPPLLTFLFFFIRQPQTQKQKIYQTAKANGWYVQAKAVKWHHATKNTDDLSEYSKIFVTYEYTINGRKQTKRFIYRDEGGDSFPTQVNVYYLKKYPNKSVFENDVEDTNFTQRYTGYKKGCGWGIVVFIIWGILVFNVLPI